MGRGGKRCIRKSSRGGRIRRSVLGCNLVQALWFDSRQGLDAMITWEVGRLKGGAVE